jgi:hypothetical protein
MSTASSTPSWRPAPAVPATATTAASQCVFASSSPTGRSTLTSRRWRQAMNSPPHPRVHWNRAFNAPGPSSRQETRLEGIRLTQRFATPTRARFAVIRAICRGRCRLANPSVAPSRRETIRHLSFPRGCVHPLLHSRARRRVTVRGQRSPDVSPLCPRQQVRRLAGAWIRTPDRAAVVTCGSAPGNGFGFHLLRQEPARTDEHESAHALADPELERFLVAPWPNRRVAFLADYEGPASRAPISAEAGCRHRRTRKPSGG